MAHARSGYLWASGQGRDLVDRVILRGPKEGSVDAASPLPLRSGIRNRWSGATLVTLQEDLWERSELPVTPGEGQGPPVSTWLAQVKVRALIPLSRSARFCLHPSELSDAQRPHQQ